MTQPATATYHRRHAHAWLDRAKQFRASLTDWDNMADEDTLREWMHDATAMAKHHLNEARAIERDDREFASWEADRRISISCRGAKS